jgi:hypothetical protein
LFPATAALLHPLLVGDGGEGKEVERFAEQKFGGCGSKLTLAWERGAGRSSAKPIPLSLLLSCDREGVGEKWMGIVSTSVSLFFKRYLCSPGSLRAALVHLAGRGGE